MTSAALQIALFAAEQLIKESPALFLQFQQAMASKTISASELASKRKTILNQNFEDLVPNSQIPLDNL